MLPLAELQSRIRLALTGDAAVAGLLLTGGRDPGRRFAIHRRHYETSLVNALLAKFPATLWLIGSRDFKDAARAFVHAHPPAAPCIAEYGRDFAKFLLNTRLAAWLPYLSDFCELEWHLGQVAAATNEPPAPITALAVLDTDQLPALTLRLQAGLRYLQTGWPVDRLMQLFLSESAPEAYVLEAEPAWLEIRGARGTFEIARTTAEEFAFRSTLGRGASVEQAAGAAFAADATFNLAAAFSNLFTQGLVAAWDHQT